MKNIYIIISSQTKQKNEQVQTNLKKIIKNGNNIHTWSQLITNYNHVCYRSTKEIKSNNKL